MFPNSIRDGADIDHQNLEEDSSASARNTGCRLPWAQIRCGRTRQTV